MLTFASIVADAAAGVGFMAGAIAVGGFLAHARPALSGAGDREVRFMTVIGGLGGLALAVLVILSSWFVG